MFTPKIINLKDRDADTVLAEIKQKLNAGDNDGINPLEVVYLPLYGSKSGKTTSELFDSALKLVPKFAKDDTQKQRKVRDLMILLVGSFLSNEEIIKILEANMVNLENNSAVRVLEDRGVMKVARNLLRRGRDVQEISEDTGLAVDKILELQNELKGELQTA